MEFYHASREHDDEPSVQGVSWLWRFIPQCESRSDLLVLDDKARPPRVPRHGSGIYNVQVAQQLLVGTRQQDWALYLIVAMLFSKQCGYKSFYIFP